MKPAGHPKALYVLFFTEMWERFGYYLMMAIFTLYLNEQKKLTTQEATSLYGTYIGMAYLTPLLGGVLSDRVLGHHRSVLAGALMLALGYLMLALDMNSVFYPALAVLVLGNGLFKPNISALVGGLYPAGDPRRDSAFGIFYLGVNIGALFSPLVASFMRSRYGWGAAYATAGAGMLIGMGTFALFGRYVVAASHPAHNPASPAAAPVSSETARERIRALLVMCAIVVFFWISFQQNGSTLALWARDNTDLTLGGWLSKPLDPVLFASVNSFFIILLTPVVLGLFQQLRRRGLEPSTPAKLGIGMVLTGASYGVMVVASLVGDNQGRVSALWLVGSYFVITIGELCLSPIGLSMVTKLAPPRAAAMMLGVWYLSTSIGNKLAGEIGVLWERWPHHQFFAVLVLGSFGAAGILLLNLQRLKAAMPGESVARPSDAPPPPLPIEVDESYVDPKDGSATDVRFAVQRRASA